MPYPVPHTIPYSLARAASVATTFNDPYNSFDFAIGGIPFRSAISPDNPMVRATAQFKKDQFDNSDEPGEQTLTGWWLRSQSSWHLGTGIKTMDVALDNTAQFRFADSAGIDPWTEGQLSLLKTATLQVAAGATTGCLGVTIAGADYVLYYSTTHLFKVDAAGTATEITWGGSDSITAITSDGANWFAVSDEGIYRGALSGTSGTKIWTCTPSHAVIRWVKNRLMAGLDNKIYELIDPGSGYPLALPTATYTHPVSTYVWTDIADGPEAIYAVGFVGSDSSILRLTLSTAGAIPTLTSATTAGELPRNEIGYSLYTYIGSFLAIGTNKGVRVAIIGGDGLIEIGNLISTPSTVYDFVGQGPWVWASYSDGIGSGLISGLLRIDLSAQLPNGKYAYATDLQSGATGTVYGVSTLGLSGRLVFAVASSGLYYEHATRYESSGYVTTGRIRYNTVWPKLFKRYNVRGTFNGPIAIATIDSSGNTVNLASVNSDTDQSQDLAIDFPAGPQEFISLKFTLAHNPINNASTPVMRGWQLKALPGGPRPHQYVVPLLCMDSELDANGVRQGYQGYGLERLEAMEQLESNGDIVVFQDLARQASALVTVEQLEFRQLAPPGPNAEVWAGVLTAVLRTVD